MSARWPLQKAKNEFSRVVNLALSQGPQTVTRHGKPVVVVSAIAAKAGAKRPRRTTKPLLALLRSCPVDLTGIVKRDRSGPRKMDLK